MNPTSSLDHIFPLSQGSAERLPLRAPRIAVRPELAPVSAFSTSLFMRSWAARRDARLAMLRASARSD